MAHLKTRWCLAAAAVAAVALAGCHDDHHDNGNTSPGNPGVVFSTFVKQIYNNDPNSTPINLQGLTFDFDVQDDPTAFDGLLM